MAHWRKITLGTLIIAVLGAVASAVFLTRPRHRAHLEINLTLLHYNEASQPVCSVTFSNLSRAVIVCPADFAVDFRTNGVWARTYYSEPGGAAGPFLPHQVSRKRFVLPRSTTAIQVKQDYQCLPHWVERAVAIPGGNTPWKLGYAAFQTITNIDCSDVLIIGMPPPVTSTSGGSLRER
jgi:hypothetical protein